MTDNKNEPAVDIHGLDLKLDNAIHQICEVSNKTSGSTRNTVHILVLTMFLIIIAIISTNRDNWKKQRIDRMKGDVTILKIKVQHFKDMYKYGCPPPFVDSLETELHCSEHNLENQIISGITHNQTVTVPVLGTNFDINDLGKISGISFIILLSILWFTFKREYNNLKIALKAITERYPPDSKDHGFDEYMGEYISKYTVLYPNGISSERILDEINRVRRKHHYNYLSMNQIYNIPPLESDSRGDTWVSRFVYDMAQRFHLWMYFSPFIIYVATVINDYATIPSGNKIHAEHTATVISLGVFFAIIILLLSILCTNKKFQIVCLYWDFFTNRKNKYSYDNKKEEDNILKLFRRNIFKPKRWIHFIGLVIGLFLLVIKLLTGLPDFSFLRSLF